MRRRTRRPRRSSRQSEPEPEVAEVEEKPEETPEGRTSRTFGDVSVETPRRRRRRSLEVEEESDLKEESETIEEEIEEAPEPEPLPPEPIQRRRRRRKPVVEPTPEPDLEEESDLEEEEEVEESTEEIEEPEPKPKPKRGRPSKQKPRKIMGPEVKPRQRRAVKFEESPQNVTVREAEPEEVVSPFQEPLMVDADDTTPPLEIDLDAVPVRRVRVEPQLARYAPPQESESVEEDELEAEEDLQEEAHLPVLLTSDELMKTLCDLLDSGYSLEMHKVGNRYVLKKGAQKIPRGKFPMTKVEADEEASTEEYKKFTEMWDELSTEERIAYAEKIGAKWDGQVHQRSAMGRLKRCVLDTSGIQKWKPEYQDAKTRMRLWKEGIRAKPL